MINNNPIPKFDVPSCSKNGVQFFNSITQQDACSRLCCVNGRFHRNGITIPLIRKSFSCPVSSPLDQSPLHTPMYFSHDHPSAPPWHVLPPHFVQFCHFSFSPTVLFIKPERRNWKVGLLWRINGQDLCIGRLDKMSGFWEKRLFHGCFPCVDVCWIILANHRYFHRWFHFWKNKICFSSYLCYI